MKNLVFLSSLNNEQQRGGAFLRVDSMAKVFSLWGLKVEMLYQDRISVGGRFQKLMASLRFGKEVMALFSKAKVNIPPCDYLVLDNFRYLHWDLIFSDQKIKPLIIYNAHNLEFENYFGKVPGYGRDKFSKYEANRIERCDLIFVCSDRERDILITLNPRLENRIHVFPNLVDARNYKSAPKKEWITFLGSLDYYPNVEAIEFICGEFFDQLPEEFRPYLVIAGRNPCPRVRELCEQRGISLRTNLTDSEITDLLASTKISLVPLVSGSGTRLKIIESLFSHAMVIATEMGAEGVLSNSLTICELDDFTRQCSRMYRDNTFHDICPESSYNSYLGLYDCLSWAKLHQEEFARILRLTS